jgi:dolichol-phosphate mannosyltransferase
MNKLPSLTVCVPLFNEEEVVDDLSFNLTKLNNDLNNKAVLNFLLIDDGSEDSTFDKLNYYFSELENFFILQHDSNLNLGGFLKSSINFATTDYITFLDSDCTFDPQMIVPMLEIIENGYDVVNASHLHPKGDTKNVIPWRILISKIANTIYRFLLRKKVYSFTSIFKMYRLEKIKKINIEFYGFVAVTELFVKCLLLDAKYYEFPCSLTTRNKGVSKLRYSETIRVHLSLIIKILRKKF